MNGTHRYTASKDELGEAGGASQQARGNTNWRASYVDSCITILIWLKWKYQLARITLCTPAKVGQEMASCCSQPKVPFIVYLFVDQRERESGRETEHAKEHTAGKEAEQRTHDKRNRNSFSHPKIELIKSNGRCALSKFCTDVDQILGPAGEEKVERQERSRAPMLSGNYLGPTKGLPEKEM